MTYMRFTSFLLLFAFLIGAAAPTVVRADDDDDDGDRIEQRIEKLNDRLEKSRERAQEQVEKTLKRAQKQQEKAQEQIQKQLEKAAENSTTLEAVKAAINARLAVRPVVIDQWDDFEDFFNDPWWRNCFPWWGGWSGHGWLKNNAEKFLKRCNPNASTTPDVVAPVISNIVVSNVGSTTATISWKTDELSTSKVVFGKSTPLNSNNSKTKTGKGKTTDHSVTLKNLKRGSVYHFFALSRDRSGNRATSTTQSFATLGTTTPQVDTTAPALSNIVVSAITHQGATVSWNTNENATGKVYYATTTPVNLATANASTTAHLVTSRSLTLTALSASTTYNFVVESKDALNNTATSSQLSFTTAVTPDIAAPSISSLLVSGVSSTSASVSWNVNELATGKVYYATSSPVNTGTASSIGTTTLLFSHLFALTGLSASTTYFLIVESKDGSTNAATTSSSFTTGN